MHGPRRPGFSAWLSSPLHQHPSRAPPNPRLARFGLACKLPANLKMQDGRLWRCTEDAVSRCLFSGGYDSGRDDEERAKDVPHRINNAPTLTPSSPLTLPPSQPPTQNQPRSRIPTRLKRFWICDGGEYGYKYIRAVVAPPPLSAAPHPCRVQNVYQPSGFASGTSTSRYTEKFSSRQQLGAYININIEQEPNPSQPGLVGTPPAHAPAPLRRPAPVCSTGASFASLVLAYFRIRFPSASVGHGPRYATILVH
ncbi:hypothetical protein R3P38DRAFT_3223419 [Favolaschia claudopus]|uniref:Uncharacterized protein n=1 Tax=Favolaschia claudopus TaxID=2862362 RepID=A0AAV9ZYW5_9AGAR